jgi:hypothetical protein
MVEWEKITERVVNTEPGWWYYIWKDGCVYRKPETRGRRKVTVKVEGVV